MRVRLVMVLCLLLTWTHAALAEGGTPGVVVQPGAVKDDHGKTIKLKRGDKVVVLTVSGAKAQVTVKGKTAWVPTRMLLIAKPAARPAPAVDAPVATSEPAGTAAAEPQATPPAAEPTPTNPPPSRVAANNPSPAVMSAAAAPSPTLRVSSEPAGALVTVDGRNVGITPSQAIPVSRGSHHVEVSLEGHQPLVQDVSVDGETTFSAAPRPLASPSEAAPASSSRALWPRLAAPVPVVLAGLVSTVLMGVGVAGAVLWVASSNALLLHSTGFQFTDSLSNNAAAMLGTRPILAVAVAMTVGGPVLALLVGAVGALAGVGLMNL